jgi:glutathione S-transferase
MTPSVLTISSKNYSSWSLRGWLLCRMSGIEFTEEVLPSNDESARAELLLLSPSFLVPRLTHRGIKVWDTLAIAEFLHELYPEAGILPSDLAKRTFCRAVSGEMHSGFVNLRSALPMNLRAHHPGFKVWAGAKADIDRITEIWHDCLGHHKGPYLFGSKPTLADAMYAPVCTRFRTYDVTLDRICTDYCEAVFAWPDMQEWREGALAEIDQVDDLDTEF